MVYCRILPFSALSNRKLYPESGIEWYIGRKELMGLAKKDTPNYVEDIRRKHRPNKDKLLEKEELRGYVKRILEYNGVGECPVNPDRIARRLGFDIVWMEFKKGSGIDGMMSDRAEEYERFGSKRFIIVDKNSNMHRRSGTIGHELGHFFLHCNSMDDFNEVYTQHTDEANMTIEEKLREQNATRFRDELLMPWFLLKDFLEEREGMLWKELIPDISQAFNVPRHRAVDHMRWSGIKDVPPKDVQGETWYNCDKAFGGI